MFNLCLAGLGGAVHPDQLELMMTGDQLVEWEEFDKLEPIGSYKQDFLFAQLENLIYVLAYAINGKQVKSKVQDFIPWWLTQYLNDDGGLGKQSVEQIKQNLLQWARQHNRALDRKAKKIKQEG